MSATSLGTADFFAGLTGRAIGYATALLWVYVVSCIGLTTYMFVAGHPMIFALSEQWSIVLFGVMNTVAMLMLYRALARGPLSVAAPIVAAHPVLVVIYAFALGSRLGTVQWLGIAFATLGAIMVARAATNDSPSVPSAKNGPTIVLAA
ncbi:MAG: EamA family transporter, partial [Rhodospirillales bacterium]|nr:EamA family transporter [Rhodospirillales bacterium]